MQVRMEIAKVTGMDPEDAKNLLLSMSQSEKKVEDEKLAELIVKVLLQFISLIITLKLIEGVGAPLFCISSLSSCCFHSLLLLTKIVSGALSNAL